MVDYDRVLKAATAARERTLARLARPDMSAEALRERERKGAEWEAQNEGITAFAGKPLEEAAREFADDLLSSQRPPDDQERQAIDKLISNPSQWSRDD